MNAAAMEEMSQHQNLRSLIKADFAMAGNDRDFKLSFEQLVKACRILLARMNFFDTRNQEKQNETYKEVSSRLEKSENFVKSNSDEIKHFLHQVHTDFENFQLRHRDEHVELG